MSFAEIKKQVNQKFQSLQKGNLFSVDVDRDKIYQVYLDGFSDEYRQEHNCNCCKSFLRQFGGVVSIIDNKIVSIWDGFDPPEIFKKSIENLRKYINSLPIASTFLADTKYCGTNKNIDVKRNVVWEHFYAELQPKFISNKINTVNAEKLNNKNVLKRALDELTLDSAETVLELIDQNSLYRGKEFEVTIKGFIKLKKEYSKTKEKDLFCWAKSLEVSPVISNIRNSSIGTLLIDLSGGMDIDTAVTRFEKVVAPTNYKRPTSLVTPKMIEQAKETLRELDLLDSLDRRYATLTDINTENLIFTDKSSGIKDTFDDMAKDNVVDLKKLTKVEEVNIADFISKIVPKAKSIEVLVENRHLSNFTSLIAPEKEAKGLFKWNNNFSWSYTGGITDSIKEKVKAAGGNVVGVLRASLAWNNYDDLDLHCIEPGGKRIYFGDRRSNSSGTLDVDMNAGRGATRSPVENIIWTNASNMSEGLYKIMVNNFCARDTSNTDFTLQIECGGEVFEFPGKNPKYRESSEITFTWSRKDGIIFSKDVRSSTVSTEKWGVKTNTFVKVKQSMLSPNYWGDSVGNKHYLFMLEGCVSDENPRPFFNEFLNQDLDKHRKVLEILGSKVKVKESKDQLSGLGFSETQKNSIIVRVDGKFQRVLKVNF